MNEERVNSKDKTENDTKLKKISDYWR